MAERWAIERRAKMEIQKMNARASAIHGKKLSGERIANLEEMSECPALLVVLLYAGMTSLQNALSLRTLSLNHILYKVKCLCSHRHTF
jgi:hypothetical protein